MPRKFGKLLKKHRMALGITLRQFCIDNNYDASNFSRLERGYYPPPQDREKLEEYAKAVGLVDGTDEWFNFFDMAAAERGEIPQDLLDDVQLMNKLPVLFRTMRQQKIDGNDLDDLIEKIRRS